MWKKALVISALTSFVTTLLVTLLTGRGYKFEPGISSVEMETHTYQEVVTMMQQRQVPNSTWEYLSNAITDPNFLLVVLGQWLVLALVILISIWVFTKWHTK